MLSNAAYCTVNTKKGKCIRERKKGQILCVTKRERSEFWRALRLSSPRIDHRIIYDAHLLGLLDQFPMRLHSNRGSEDGQEVRHAASSSEARSCIHVYVNVCIVHVCLCMCIHKKCRRKRRKQSKRRKWLMKWENLEDYFSSWVCFLVSTRRESVHIYNTHFHYCKI